MASLFHRDQINEINAINAYNDMNQIDEIKKYCEENDILLLVLFGSFAKEKTHEKSDIDIAVVMENNGSSIDKLRLICGLESIFGRFIDLVVVTEKTDPLLLYEIFSSGKPLYERRKGLFLKYRLTAWKKYLDTERMRRLEKNFVREYIRRINAK